MELKEIIGRIMKLKYRNNSIYYRVKCPNVGYYVYYFNNLPDKVYKNQLFGLRFMILSGRITNLPLGIKIEYGS